MVIDPHAAQTFIHGYSRLLAKIYTLSKGKAGIEVLQMLAAGRDVAIATPSIIASAASELEHSGKPVSLEVIGALRSLQLKQWVYLRDSTAYSVFLDPSGNDAYAVFGLTDRLRDILGGTGAYLRTGVVEFGGRFVCDGIVSNCVWLGTNYRKQFAAHLATIKKMGSFRVSPTSD